MTALLAFVLYASLAVHVVLSGIALWRVWRGENIVDRLIGAELVSTISLAILVLVALISRNSIYVDVALALAVLGFAGTIAMAKYIADEQMF